MGLKVQQQNTKVVKEFVEKQTLRYPLIDNFQTGCVTSPSIPIPDIGDQQHVDKDISEHQHSLPSIIQWQKQQHQIKIQIKKDNPRLEKFQSLLELLSEIILWRIESKKHKKGYVQATINQITVGFQIPEEWNEN